MKRSNAFDRIHISLDSYGCVTGATFPDGLTMASLVVENSKVWENLHARARENGNQRDQIAGLEAELASTVQTVLEKDVEIAQLEMSKEHWISSSNFYREQADEITFTGITQEQAEELAADLSARIKVLEDNPATGITQEQADTLHWLVTDSDTAVRELVGEYGGECVDYDALGSFARVAARAVDATQVVLFEYINSLVKPAPAEDGVAFGTCFSSDLSKNGKHEPAEPLEWLGVPTIEDERAPWNGVFVPTPEPDADDQRYGPEPSETQRIGEFINGVARAANTPTLDEQIAAAEAEYSAWYATGAKNMMWFGGDRLYDKLQALRAKKAEAEKVVKTLYVSATAGDPSIYGSVASGKSKMGLAVLSDLVIQLTTTNGVTTAEVIKDRGTV
jgi:hypothetical protein